MQMATSGGQIGNQYKWRQFRGKICHQLDNSSSGLNSHAPLRLWRCFDPRFPSN